MPHLIYTTLYPIPITTNNQATQRIAEDSTCYLLEVIKFQDKTIRGVTKDRTLWFLAEDILKTLSSPYEKQRLLDNIKDEYKKFIYIVDDVGTRRHLLMISMKGIIDRLVN